MESKADKIRAYLIANPTVKVKDAAQTLGVNLQYVYLIKKKLKKAAGKATKPSAGQQALRQVIKQDDGQIQSLRAELYRMACIITYLENKLEQRRGASV